jgi:Nif-specific regulatory protein
MRLVATAGPLAGTALTLADGLTLAGFDVGAEDDRACCRIRAGADGFVLTTVDRRTPVFVNGLPVTTRALQPRDELRVRDALFIVREDEAAPPNPAVASCETAPFDSSAARRLLEVPIDEALLGDDAGAAGHGAGELPALIRVGAALSSIEGLATIDAALAGLLFDVLPIERVAFADGGEGQASVRSAWSARAGGQCMPVDTALLERVSADRAAVVVEHGGRQAAAAPLTAFGRACGSVWAETPRGGTLDRGHVRVLLFVASLAAMAREHAREAARLQETNELLQAEINVDHNMVGRSRPMRALFERIGRAARTDTTVLIRGESGTGKELVARAVHRNSARAARPFVAINCAALTETLLESELFGHEKGAFTGAIGLKKGKLEVADGGTLFLDEIGELPAGLQAKLLRALQEREFERVGGTRPVRVDFRLIAATNRDLDAAVKAGTFRQDLFYRLNVVTLALPPLRDRREDLPALAEYFVRKHAPRCGRRVQGLRPDAQRRLARHDWPGNVRELENVIEQALALGAADWIGADDLPPGLGESPSAAASSLDYHEAIDQARRDLIARAFERAGRNHTAAARLLNVHPNYLHRLIRNLDLKPRLSKAQP